MIMDLAERLSPQHRRLFKFHHLTEPDQPLLLESFRGSEGLSQPFTYELLLICDAPQLPLKSMLGQQVSIEVELADAAPRFINGYLTRFASKGSDGALDHYGADYRQPRNRLPVAMRSLNEQGAVQRFEVYDPGQYTHSTYDEGEALLRRRVEVLELAGKHFEGASNCRAMRPGYQTGPVEEREFLLMAVTCEATTTTSAASRPVTSIPSPVCARRSRSAHN